MTDKIREYLEELYILGFIESGVYFDNRKEHINKTIFTLNQLYAEKFLGMLPKEEKLTGDIVSKAISSGKNQLLTDIKAKIKEMKK